MVEHEFALSMIITPLALVYSVQNAIIMAF